MSRGMTIADLVQQVFYAIYKVRLDVTSSQDNGVAFHSSTDKFKEIVMEANFVLQELQKEQDWGWLRQRLSFGDATNPCDCNCIVEYELPEHVYKVCTGFNDAVRLHDPRNHASFIEVPYTSPRSGTVNTVAMFDRTARINVPDDRLQAFVVGDTLTFNRRFNSMELGRHVETDIIRMLEPLHICGPGCEPNCPLAYEAVVLKEIPDPYYMVIKTAAKRAEGDPSASDRVMALTDESMKLLSAMRENDSSKTVPDTYSTVDLGYMRVL